MRKAKLELKVKKSENNLRLDKYLKIHFPDWGRNAIKKLVNSRQIEINGKVVWLGSWKLNVDDEIKFYYLPDSKQNGFSEFDPSWIFFEDSDLVVVNKPSGLKAHASISGRKDNLLDLANQRWGKVSLFHRLDRDTSGITLLTKTKRLNRYLDQSFQTQKVKKTYLAIVSTNENLETLGAIRKRIGEHLHRRDMRSVVEKGGKAAFTKYRIIAEAAGKTLLEVQPETGRMHQIRVHLSSLGSPILGDILYGKGKKDSKRLLLHAMSISLPEIDEFPTRNFFCLPDKKFIQKLPEELVIKINAIKP